MSNFKHLKICLNKWEWPYVRDTKDIKEVHSVKPVL